jgi:hypothetical protein
MEGAGVVLAATVNVVNRKGCNISFGRITRRLVLRACDYHHQKFISSLQYF